MKSEPTVFVVDDDPALRDSLACLMESVGLPVETHASAQDFLSSFDAPRRGCLLLDIRMPGMTGLELQELLVRHGVRIPVIVISAHADVEQAVRAMKTGAMDFIKKPYDAEVLVERVRQALALDAQICQEQAEQEDAAVRVARLTPREREIDVHRGHIMAKLKVESLLELARIVQLEAARDEMRLPHDPASQPAGS
jgi:two-component system response regulator FixJ